MDMKDVRDLDMKDNWIGRMIRLLCSSREEMQYSDDNKKCSCFDISS